MAVESGDPEPRSRAASDSESGRAVAGPCRAAGPAAGPEPLSRLADSDLGFQVSESQADSVAALRLHYCKAIQWSMHYSLGVHENDDCYCFIVVCKDLYWYCYAIQFSSSPYVEYPWRQSCWPRQSILISTQAECTVPKEFKCERCSRIYCTKYLRCHADGRESHYFGETGGRNT